MCETTIKIKTELERQLYDCYLREKSAREKLEVLVNDLKVQVQSLQQQLENLHQENQCSKGQKRNEPTEQAKSNIKFAQSEIEYCTDEDELAKETEWIRAKSRKKRKLNISLSPQQQPGTSAQQQNYGKEPPGKKVPPPPPIIVEGVKNYQTFYDSLIEIQPAESFTAKMMNGDCVKLNAKSEDSYRVIAKLLTEKSYHWYSYENKQARPIRVVVKKLHSSCQPDRIKDDLAIQGLKIEKVDNKLSWKSKEPLNMFVLSFHNDEDVNKIYGIKNILGCKIEIHPLKNPKLIPQCKRCQAYGHTHKYCQREPRCVKCTGKHLTANCTKSPQDKPKCVHCGLPHPANYRGCEVAKEMQLIKNKNIKKKPDVTTSQQFPPMRHEKQAQKVSTQATPKPAQGTNFCSYAQAAKQGSSNIEDKINQILKCITTFDKRLEKLECSTKTAVSNNQK